jgi:hypothetical protein
MPAPRPSYQHGFPETPLRGRDGQLQNSSHEILLRHISDPFIVSLSASYVPS